MLLLAAACAVSSACGLATGSPQGSSAVERVSLQRRQSLRLDAGRVSTDDYVWREAARGALERPTEIVPPYAERGALLPTLSGALGIAFAAEAGDVLRLQLDGAAIGGPGACERCEILVDLLRFSGPDSAAAAVPSRHVAIDGSALRARLPTTGRYLVRLQPERRISLLYELELELGATLPFPVRSRGLEAVQSFFGDPREGGKRRHEGIDIFAARSTPVVAVAAGWAVPRRNELGGNTVFLNTPGVSYYYAHLERAAFDAPRPVAAGAVLGYVGNSGNAEATPPHLHFAIYRWGRGAIDPLPLLSERRPAAGSAPGASRGRLDASRYVALRLR